MARTEAVTLADKPEDELHDRFRSDVLAGLAQEQKTIPARWFYDRRGSELFEDITALPEYYPTRTEISILEGCCPDVTRLVGAGRAVIEFGAGSAAKTPILLDCMDPSVYVPIDISGDFLRDSCDVVQTRYPDLPIIPIEADFTRPVALPPETGDAALLGFFPGSTIGNMQPSEAVDLLRSIRSTLDDGAYLLIGMDLIKDRDRLIEAYDDAAGVTAAFNMNVASRINSELGGTIPLDGLAHKAVWNDRLARIEMHLEAQRDIAFDVCGERFAMDAGETIHTENSHKYSQRSGNLMLLAGGWEPIARYTDPQELFMVVLARAISRTLTA